MNDNELFEYGIIPSAGGPGCGCGCVVLIAIIMILALIVDYLCFIF